MPFYRFDFDDGTTGWAHMNFGRKQGPAPCTAFDAQLQARCGRMGVALCDYPVTYTAAHGVVTCSESMCEKHRTNGGIDVDFCQKHAEHAPQRALSFATEDVRDEGSR